MLRCLPQWVDKVKAKKTINQNKLQRIVYNSSPTLSRMSKFYGPNIPIANACETLTSLPRPSRRSSLKKITRNEITQEVKSGRHQLREERLRVRALEPTGRRQPQAPALAAPTQGSAHLASTRPQPQEAPDVYHPLCPTRCRIAGTAEVFKKNISC